MRLKEIVGKLERIAPYTKGFGWASAGLPLLIAGYWLYQAFHPFSGRTERRVADLWGFAVPWLLH
jgi:hypothetical protein